MDHSSFFFVVEQKNRYLLVEHCRVVHYEMMEGARNTVMRYRSSLFLVPENAEDAPDFSSASRERVSCDDF